VGNNVDLTLFQSLMVAAGNPSTTLLNSGVYLAGLKVCLIIGP